MDTNLVKGHFFLGQALLEMGSLDESVKHLQRGIRYVFICIILNINKGIFL